MDLDIKQFVLDSMMSQRKLYTSQISARQNIKSSQVKKETTSEIFKSVISQPMTVQELNLVHLAATELNRQKEEKQWEEYRKSIFPDQKQKAVKRKVQLYQHQPHVITLPVQRPVTGKPYYYDRIADAKQPGASRNSPQVYLIK